MYYYPLNKCQVIYCGPIRFKKNDQTFFKILSKCPLESAGVDPRRDALQHILFYIKLHTTDILQKKLQW